jgi:hypothetical protein
MTTLRRRQASLRGQVVHMRKVSKKLFFYDVLDDDGGRRCVVMKSWICGEPEMKRASRGDNKIHCGDKMVFSGLYEEDDTQILAAKTYSIVERWAESNQTLQFQPIPPAASSKEAEKESACKFWLNSGRCPKGDGCPFKHPVKDVAASRQNYVGQRLEKRQLAQLSQDGHHGDDDDLKSRHQRASIFAEWLFDQFADVPDAGVVLDVAGGRRGDVAYELTTKMKKDSDIRVVTVDPRGVQETTASAKRTLPKWKEKKRKKEFETRRQPEVVARCFDEEFFSEFSAEHDIRLLIGMHPDQATEAIVDLGLKRGIPFAVVPCCVFAHLTPERRLKSGQEPTTYDEFVSFLMEKDARIKCDNLGFKGRERVLYWTG